MNYSTTLITAAPDCQALIDIATSEKDGLSFRKTGLERQRQTSTLSSAEIVSELASVTIEINALQTVMASLPEGSTKVDTLRKLRKAEYKKFLLEQRQANYGVMSLLTKEYDIACIEKDITEADAFITALTDRMNAL